MQLNDCLKCFVTKKRSLSGLKALIKILTTQVVLFDVLGSGRPRTVRTVSVVSIFYGRPM